MAIVKGRCGPRVRSSMELAAGPSNRAHAAPTQPGRRVSFHIHQAPPTNRYTVSEPGQDANVRFAIIAGLVIGLNKALFHHLNRSLSVPRPPDIVCNDRRNSPRQIGAMPPSTLTIEIHRGKTIDPRIQSEQEIHLWGYAKQIRQVVQRSNGDGTAACSAAPSCRGAQTRTILPGPLAAAVTPANRPRSTRQCDGVTSPGGGQRVNVLAAGFPRASPSDQIDPALYKRPGGQGRASDGGRIRRFDMATIGSDPPIQAQSRDGIPSGLSARALALVRPSRAIASVNHGNERHGPTHRPRRSGPWAR